MLMKEVIDSKAIALAAENAASNSIPFLGLNWFPEEKKAGLDLKWIKTRAGLPVSLKPSNFDAIPTLRARKGLATEKTQMAFFRESMDITEEDEQEIARIQDANDPYLEAALNSIYDDTTNLLRGAEVVPEIMRMSLLAGQNIVLSSDGVNYTYDYDPDNSWKTDHYVALSGTAKWSDAAATPLTDLNNMRKALAQKGKIARYVLMNSTTFAYLPGNAQIRSAMLAQNVTANIFVTDDLVKQIIRNATQLEVVVYDKMYTNYAGTDQKLYPDDYVTLLPSEPVGKQWFGTTPEERTAAQVAGVDVSMYGKGIAVAVKTEYGPPAKTSTTASEITLPSFEGMDSVAVIKVN